MDQVDRLEIPTPFHIGRVNGYLFDGDGLTLLDPGPATDEAYEALTAQFEKHGHAVEDLDRILITHPHMDHFGLASRIRERSEATVYAHHDAAEILTDPDAHLEHEQAVFEPYFVRMGVPESTVGTVVSLPTSFVEFQKPITVDEPIGDGDRLDVGTDLDILYTPGHCPGSVCFLDRANDIAYTGDHVMAEISPNPLLTIVPGTTDERTRSLPTYLDSLDRLRETGIGGARGGHRGLVTDLPARIDEIVDHHQSRKRRIASILETEGRATAYDLMNELFPDLPVTEVFPGMSEIIGHLDLLEDEGAVVRTGEETWYYEPA
ncbi:MBL fold metallo-hydrolase [Halosolutus halophilus]|uniref:MBL fold metallo-hydrolase n=1 Tax=Halosolutus halophilus TaxID=1552990 RepID=UPI002235037D|nr:MBL fold metallo-hydrolase [Halosolutus halophilus]